MAKRKAESVDPSPDNVGSKKIKKDGISIPKVMSSLNMLVDSDSDSERDDAGGATLEEPGFKINEDFAKRFEHNKKREERQKLEDKFNNDKEGKRADGKLYGDKYDEDEDSSSDEDEDDDGFLATEDLDAEISATLNAIRNKDPRVYDEKSTFYRPIDEDEAQAKKIKKDKKPMTLQDYHRENLLAGRTGADLDEEEPAPRTFVQEQEDLKKSIIKEMHQAADGDDSANEAEDSDEDGFLKPKEKAQKPTSSGLHPSRLNRVKVDINPAEADKDPETYLSNFMAARAWVPTDGARFQPLESDDDEEDEMAEKFEEAYNLRFEDPKGSNEMLKSYARDVVASRSVRRDEPKGRKKQRDLEREKKDAEKKEREDDRARLRKLKIEEMEERLQKIKKAAGIKGASLKDNEWTKFLDENWDDDDWEKEMGKKFGEDYYAEQDVVSNSDDEESAASKRKVKKPKWDDDIDIKDLIPDFVEDDDEKPDFTLSDSEADADAMDVDADEEGTAAKKSKSNKDHKAERAAKKKAARLERQKIEELVDNRLDVDTVTLPGKSKQQAVFRYRETSPSSYGLTARDILLADDTALNQWAGLKKLASFRDVEKKRKDKKRLSKKARLKEWRKETFGNEDGPEVILAPKSEKVEDDGENVVDGKRKRKRSKNKA